MQFLLDSGADIHAKNYINLTALHHACMGDYTECAKFLIQHGAGVDDETIFGTQSRFRKHFANPLLAAREPDATDSEIEIGTRRQVELAELTSKFVLRRTNELNKVHLPNKLTMVVVCPLSPLQQQLYEHLTRAENLDRENNKYSILSAITSLKKLVNHPKKIF